MLDDLGIPASDLTKTKRDQKRDNKRAVIVKQAAILFEEKGYSKTRMEDIANRVGFSLSTFYEYFSSKEDILKFTEEIEYQKFIEALSRFSALSPSEEVLRIIYRQWIEESLKRRMLLSKMQDYYIMFIPGPRVTRAEDIIARLVQRGIRKAEFKAGTNPEIIAILLSGTRDRLYRCNQPDKIDELFNAIITPIRLVF